jgi:hypothetical protein
MGYDDVAHAIAMLGQAQERVEPGFCGDDDEIPLHHVFRGAHQEHVGMQRLRDDVAAAEQLRGRCSRATARGGHRAPRRPRGSSAERCDNRASSRISSSPRSLPRIHRPNSEKRLRPDRSTRCHRRNFPWFYHPSSRWLGQTLFHRYLGHSLLGRRFFRNHVQFHHVHYAGDHLVSSHYLDDGQNNTLFFLMPVAPIVGLG